MEQPILPLRDAPVLADAAAVWFSRRWGIPAESYRESMEQCLRRKAPVPQWYVVRDGGRLLAGAGVIANDFHEEGPHPICPLSHRLYARGQSAHRPLHLAHRPAQHQGTFILRIEDTDQTRQVEGATEVIYRTLAECHLDHMTRAPTWAARWPPISRPSGGTPMESTPGFWWKRATPTTASAKRRIGGGLR